jgi:putative sigma-54 modulation protein
MKVRMTARHFDLKEGLKEHVEGRSSQLERFFDNIIDLHWVMEMDKHRHSAELSAQVHGSVLTSRAETGDMRASVDEVTNKMESQLKKYKERLKDRDQRGIANGKTAFSFGSPASEEGASDQSNP